MAEAPLKRLHFLAKKDPLHFKDILFRVVRITTEDAEDFQMILWMMEDILRALSAYPPIRDFYVRHLTAQWLLGNPICTPEWLEWARNRLSFADHLPDAVLDDPCPGRWRVAAVLAVGGRNAHLRYFLAGPAPKSGSRIIWPDWADALFSDPAADAIRMAGEAVQILFPGRESFSFCCFPLAPANGRVQFTGPSLGLPIALAMAAVEGEIRLSSKVAATGAVDPNGKVLPVGQIEEKASGAKGFFDVLICPGDNLYENELSGIRLLPVHTLAQAWMAANLYGPERMSELILFSEMLKDPRTFIGNLEKVPHDWLAWARHRGMTEPVTRKIAAVPVLFAGLARQLERCVRESRTLAAEALSSLISPETLAASAEEAPLSAFRWCSMNLSLFNHLGQVRRAKDWAQKAAAYLATAARADITVVADHYNHHFVACHNRYEFSPDLPPELVKILKLLEAQYALQCDFGCPTHPALGRLYGSISQNFGFCGPGWLDSMIGYSRKARKALGEGAVREYKEEWLRHYNYLTYALLDAGDLRGAQKTLLACFEARFWDALQEIIQERFSDLTKWQHALFARYAADTGEGDFYDEICRTRLLHPPRAEHPWQLWSFNMGRIGMRRGRKKAAAARFEQSLELCRSPHFGSTVRVMTLLPLSGLYDLRAITAEGAIRSREAVMDAVAQLNQAHFRMVQDLPFDGLLARIRKAPQVLFPFNYR